MYKMLSGPWRGETGGAGVVRWPVVTAVGDSLVNSSVRRLPGWNERKPSEFEPLHVAVVCLTSAVPRLVSLVSRRAVYLSVDLSVK